MNSVLVRYRFRKSVRRGDQMDYAEGLFHTYAEWDDSTVYRAQSNDEAFVSEFRGSWQSRHWVGSPVVAPLAEAALLKMRVQPSPPTETPDHHCTAFDHEDSSTAIEVAVDKDIWTNGSHAAQLTKYTHATVYELGRQVRYVVVGPDETAGVNKLLEAVYRPIASALGEVEMPGLPVWILFSERVSAIILKYLVRFFPHSTTRPSVTLVRARSTDDFDQSLSDFAIQSDEACPVVEYGVYDTVFRSDWSPSFRPPTLELRPIELKAQEVEIDEVLTAGPTIFIERAVRNQFRASAKRLGLSFTVNRAYQFLNGRCEGSLKTFEFDVPLTDSVLVPVSERGGADRQLLAVKVAP